MESQKAAVLDSRVDVMRWLRTAILYAVVLFPVLANLVRSAGSITITLLTLAGLPVVFSSRLRPSLHPHEKKVMWAFAAYSIVYVISFMLNGFFFGNIPELRMSYIDHEIRFLTIIPIFMLLRYLLIPQAALWAGILLGALLSGGWALLSYGWLYPGERVSGSYHPIAFGDLSLVLAFMSIPALDYLKDKSRRLRWVPVAALVFGTAASLLSETRGAWIAIPAMTMILFFYSATLVKKWIRLTALIAVVLVSLGAYHLPGTRVADRVDAFFEEIADYQKGDRSYSSSASRIVGWQVAFDIFTDHPFIGAGPGSYEPMMLKKIEQGKPYQIAAVHSQPHGAYPSTMADCGLLGLAALLFLFAAPFGLGVYFIRKKASVRHIGYALVLHVTGFMHFGLTETIFSRNINVTFYLVMTALLTAAAANQIEAESVAGAGNDKALP